MWLVNFRATDKMPVVATHIGPVHLDQELLGDEGLYLCASLMLLVCYHSFCLYLFG